MKTIYSVWLLSYSWSRIGIFTWDGVRQATARPELLKPPLRKSKPWVFKYSCMFWILYIYGSGQLESLPWEIANLESPISTLVGANNRYMFVFHNYHFLDHLGQLQFNVLDITSRIWTIGRGLLTWGRSLLSLLQSICKCKTFDGI